MPVRNLCWSLLFLLITLDLLRLVLLLLLQSKEKLLTDLRKELQITTQEHFEVLTAVMQDKEIEALRENRVLEPQPAAADAGLLKRKKDVMGAR